MPLARLKSVSGRVRVGFVAAALPTIGLAIPLTITSLRSAGQAQSSQAVNQSIVTWLEAYPTAKLTSVAISGREVSVKVSGPMAPPSTSTLNALFCGVVGPKIGVHVQRFHTN